MFCSATPLADEQRFVLNQEASLSSVSTSSRGIIGTIIDTLCELWGRFSRWCAFFFNNNSTTTTAWDSTHHPMARERLPSDEYTIASLHILNGRACELLIPKEEHLQVVQRPKSVSQYLDLEYKGSTPEAKRCRIRLHNIEMHYAKHQVYPVRGDGNCFCNAALAGLLSIPNQRENIAKIFAEKQKEEGYIEPDSSSGISHLTFFNKEADLSLVISCLEKKNLTTQNLLEDYKFTSAFSRVLRYILNLENEELCPRINGQECDIQAIFYINAIFNIQAKGVVLASSGNANLESPDSAYVLDGRTLYANLREVNLTEANSELEKPEFLLVLKGAHFITLT